MQILVFVCVTIMSLSYLTYGKLEQGVAKEHLRNTMQELYHSKDAEYFNNRVHKQYESIRSAESESSTSLEDTQSTNEDKKEQGLPNLSRQLNVSSLFLGGDDSDTVLVKNIFERLLKSSYAEQKFFQEYGQVIGLENLVDHLIQTVRRSVEESHGKIKLNSVSGLSTLDVQDDQLQEFLYFILKGGDDFPSLKQLIRISKSAVSDSLVSVYLAEKEVLQSILRESSSVEECLLYRRQLYAQTKYKGFGQDYDKKKLLEEDLRRFMLPYLQDSSWESYLDFRVTGTKPKT